MNNCYHIESFMSNLWIVDAMSPFLVCWWYVRLAICHFSRLVDEMSKVQLFNEMSVDNLSLGDMSSCQYVCVN